MRHEFALQINQTPFDENYAPAAHTRLTTNFANLARGENRQENLRKTLAMINTRFNELAHWDNPTADRYEVTLEIVSVDLDVAGTGEHFPIIEVLNTTVFDKHLNRVLDGMVGNSFSSYVRDYDFSVRLPAFNQARKDFAVPEDFGDLHGKLFQYVVNSEAYQCHFKKPPVMCLSVSSSKTYYRTENQHPILGVEYRQSELSPTDQYFAKMGLKVRYFMPAGSSAPFAFYFAGDLLSDYSNLELISTISTMETFQRIYRPEIYNANAKAGAFYAPRLTNQNHSLTQIEYDRTERSALAVNQGHYTEQAFIKPYHDILQSWAAAFSA